MRTSLKNAACGVAFLVAGGIASAQQPTAEERVAALKSSLASSNAALRSYEWIETTVVNLKGEDKSTTRERCSYGAAGKLSVSPQPGNRVRLTLAGYLKPGDTLTFEMNLADNTIASAGVASTMDSDKAPVAMTVTYGKLDTGAVYQQQTVLDAKGKDLKVTVQNSGYRKTGS